MSEEELHELAETAYLKVLLYANRVLHKCRLYSIQFLAKENPTLTEIANEMRLICEIIDTIVENTANALTGDKARSYADHVQAIAAAVDAGDEDGLRLQVDLLDKRSFA